MTYYYAIYDSGYMISLLGVRRPLAWTTAGFRSPGRKNAGTLMTGPVIHTPTETQPCVDLGGKES